MGQWLATLHSVDPSIPPPPPKLRPLPKDRKATSAGKPIVAFTRVGGFPDVTRFLEHVQSGLRQRGVDVEFKEVSLDPRTEPTFDTAQSKAVISFQLGDPERIEWDGEVHINLQRTFKAGQYTLVYLPMSSTYVCVCAWYLLVSTNFDDKPWILAMSRGAVEELEPIEFPSRLRDMYRSKEDIRVIDLQHKKSGDAYKFVGNEYIKAASLKLQDYLYNIFYVPNGVAYDAGKKKNYTSNR
jgi:hypothetical protein